ncbi:retrovirus-related Pol polyprotein isoform X3 [Danio rerio]
MQTFAMGLEKNKWRQSGCVMKDNVWKCAEGKVKAAQGKAAERPLHSLRPGDFVVIRDLRRKSWRAKRWLGPFQVLLTTETAVKVAERATWVHAGHCRKVPSPEKDSTRQ